METFQSHASNVQICEAQTFLKKQKTQDAECLILIGWMFQNVDNISVNEWPH